MNLSIACRMVTYLFSRFCSKTCPVKNFLFLIGFSCLAIRAETRSKEAATEEGCGRTCRIAGKPSLYVGQGHTELCRYLQGAAQLAALKSQISLTLPTTPGYSRPEFYYPLLSKRSYRPRKLCSAARSYDVGEQIRLLRTRHVQIVPMSQ